MKKCVIYIHGKGGSADESDHYKPLFAGFDVIGFDYQAQTPWKAKTEFTDFFAGLSNKYEQIVIIANSIGAFFAIHALNDMKISEAFFISPIVNIEHLIENMMNWAGITEAELKQNGTIQIFGETLSWEYLSWVRNNQINWRVTTHILYGGNDNLQSLEDIKNFSAKTGAEITVMNGGEHWFHTEEQMRFLDNCIANRKVFKELNAP